MNDNARLMNRLMRGSLGLQEEEASMPPLEDPYAAVRGTSADGGEGGDPYRNLNAFGDEPENMNDWLRDAADQIFSTRL